MPNSFPPVDEQARPSASARPLAAAVIALLLVVGTACAGTPSNDASAAATSTSAPPTTSAPTDVAAPATLPEREGERRQTSGTVPHVQLDPQPVAEIDAEFRRRAFLLPGVTNEPSGVSLPGAVQLALDPNLALARPDVIAASGEFAHIHPDGSLHIWLPVPLALEVHDKKWGELHPWADRDGFWSGVVMVYTPESPEHIDVTMQILVEAYNFVVGTDLDHTEIT